MWASISSSLLFITLESLRQLAAHLIGVVTPLGFRRHMVRLDEGDGASGNDTSAALAPRRKSVPSGNAHGYQLVFSMHATEAALGAS